MFRFKNSNSLMLSFLALILLIQNDLTASERRFSYTYETNVLPKGLQEIEVWNTSRIARSYFFRRIDQRIEYEIGLGNNLQAAFYINQTNELKDDNGTTALGSISRKTNLGFSNELKYKIFDNVADPIGFAIYGEYTFYPHETEIEAKLLFDKKFDDFLIALNFVYEKENKFDFKNGLEINTTEIFYEADFGTVYYLNPQFTIGMEVVNKNSIVNSAIDKSVLFAGPTISFSTPNFWVVASYLPQLKAFKGATINNLNLSSYEKSYARILFSFEL